MGLVLKRLRKESHSARQPGLPCQVELKRSGVDFSKLKVSVLLSEMNLVVIFLFILLSHFKMIFVASFIPKLKLLKL